MKNISIAKAVHNIESRRGNIRELTTAEIVIELESELLSLKAMEGKEVSDEDIMIEADRIKDNVKLFHFDPVSFQYGAQAHRDGLIPASGKAQIKEQKCKRKQDNSDGICPDCGKDHYEGRSV